MSTSVPSFTNGDIPSSSTAATRSTFWIVPAAASQSDPAVAHPASSVSRGTFKPSFALSSTSAVQTSPNEGSTKSLPAAGPSASSSSASLGNPRARSRATASTSAYKPPAHKHAHHLHSIPPREKTAKTLILDHMLWQHSRARFHQARSELGLPHQLNSHLGFSASYLNSARDKEEEATRRSEAELLVETLEHDMKALKFGVRNITDRYKVVRTTEAKLAENVDLDTANVQRANAEGMEKVLSSLIRQTSEEQHYHDHSLSSRNEVDKSCLCDSVRIRLALSALVNEFFARDQLSDEVDHERKHKHDRSKTLDGASDHDDVESEDEQSSHAQFVYPQREPASAMSISSLVSPSARVSSFKKPYPPTIADPDLPDSLLPLSNVSSYLLLNSLQSSVAVSEITSGSASNSKTRTYGPPPGSIFSTIPKGAGPEGPWALGRAVSSATATSSPSPEHHHSTHGTTSSASPSSTQGGPAPRVWKPLGRNLQFYNAGVSKSSIDRRLGPFSELCPRHLASKSECRGIGCMFAQQDPNGGDIELGSGGGGASWLDRGRRRMYVPGVSVSVGSGLGKAGVPLRRRLHAYADGVNRHGGDRAAKRRRLGGDFDATGTGVRNIDEKHQASRNGRNTRMIALLPRFLRFSALIARELGREARQAGEQTEVERTSWHDPPPAAPSEVFNEVPKMFSRGPEHATAMDNLDPVSSIAFEAPSSTGDARPTRAWYALTCGLVTRAVLEGYISGGWKGAAALEVLFGLGIGAHLIGLIEAQTTDDSKKRKSQDDDSSEKSADEQRVLQIDEDEDDLENQLEPDGLPSLAEATAILFGRALPGSSLALLEGSESDVPSAAFTSNVTRSPTSPLSPSNHSGPRRSRPRHEHVFGFVSASYSPKPAPTRPGVGDGDPDWEWETSERISEFAGISLGSPDLLAHMHELAKRYPPEPVERAALRFFEAVAEWRGTPELETYKARARGGMHHPPSAVRPNTSSNPNSVQTSPQILANGHAKGTEGGDLPPPALGSAMGSGATPTLPSQPVLAFFTIPRELVRLPQAVVDPPSENAMVSGGMATSSRRHSPLIEVADWVGPYGV